jgi:hypothetical protein
MERRYPKESPDGSSSRRGAQYCSRVGISEMLDEETEIAPTTNGGGRTRQMVRRAGNDQKLTIFYIDPTYANLEERQAAVESARAAVIESAGLWGRMVAGEIIRETTGRARVSSSEPTILKDLAPR